MPQSHYGTYKNVWYGRGGKEAGDRVRTEFNNNLKAYLAAYPDEHGAAVAGLTSCMALFTRWQVQMLREARRRPYSRVGSEALCDLRTALGGGHPERNWVFVALDFEGYYGDHEAVSQLGVSVFDSRQLLQSVEQYDIHSQNFTYTGGKRDRAFIFGEPARVPVHRIPGLLREIFDTHANLSGGVVLVGHSLHMEIHQMDKFGISIESVPSIVGMIDTSILARDVLGLTGSLGRLLDTCGIPFHWGLLHCAGNDAHLTLRLTLALTLQMVDRRLLNEDRKLAMQELIYRP